MIRALSLCIDGHLRRARGDCQSTLPLKQLHCFIRKEDLDAPHQLRGRQALLLSLALLLQRALAQPLHLQLGSHQALTLLSMTPFSPLQVRRCYDIDSMTAIALFFIPYNTPLRDTTKTSAIVLFKIMFEAEPVLMSGGHSGHFNILGIVTSHC